MSKQEEHWKDTSKLTVITLILWFIFSIVVHAFVHSLNTISFLVFPFGYYMAAQGSLLAFVVIIFFSPRYIRRQVLLDGRSCATNCFLVTGWILHHRQRDST